MNIKWAVLHLGTKLDRERKDVIENINYILKKIQEKGLDIGILLENSEIQIALDHHWLTSWIS